MNSILIIYSTTDGQTLDICRRIAEIISTKSIPEIVSLKDVNQLNLSKYKKIIIGASIRYGKHKPELYNFIKENLNVLNKIESAFFSVNVVARKSEKNTPKTNPYMKKFLKLSPWKPQNLAVFAGKIDYQSYKFIDKHMIRFIMWIGKGPTNLKGSYEFTNWQAVDAFAHKMNI
jgi:menaquinone-dependent protoporphyrinogen oxidase